MVIVPREEAAAISPVHLGKLNLTAHFVSPFLRQDRLDFKSRHLCSPNQTQVHIRWTYMYLPAGFQHSSRDFSVGGQTQMQSQQMHSVNLEHIHWDLHTPHGI